MGAEARELACAGFKVLPLKGKVPLVARGLHDASSDLDKVASWWSRWRNANIGISVPADVIVLDLDAQGAESIKARDYSTPATVSARTGRGSHLYYALPEHLRDKAKPQVKILPDVDIRARGSYVVAPPSFHFEQRVRYQWDEGRSPWDAQMSLCPDWLAQLVLTGATVPPSSGSVAEAMKYEGINPSEVLRGVGEGQRDERLFRYACHLRGRGYGETEARALVLIAAQNCDPPFSTQEAHRKVTSAWRYPTHRAAAYGEDVQQKARIMRERIGPAFDVSTLVDQEVEQVKWLVDELVSPGLWLVAGAPKSGKSFLTQEVARAITTPGDRALDHCLCASGHALYLDLEVSERLARRRWQTILGRRVTLPQGLSLRFSWPRMDEGGIEAIEEQIEADPELRLVVVDVLEHFMPSVLKSGGTAYQIESRLMRPLNDLVHRHADRGFTLALVHHVRKGDASNPLDKVSGSNAIAGSVHTAWIMSRKANSTIARVHVTGKEVEEQSLDLFFWSKRDLRWSFHPDQFDPVQLNVARELGIRVPQNELMDALFGDDDNLEEN